MAPTSVAVPLRVGGSGGAVEIDGATGTPFEDTVVHRDRVEPLLAELVGGLPGRAHGVAEPVTAAGWPLLGEYKGHASIREPVEEGYQILTF